MKWWSSMSKQDKIITGSAVISVLTLGGILIYKKIQKNKQLGENYEVENEQENTNTTSSGNSNSNPKPIASGVNKNLVLKKGSKGKEVKELQRLLGVGNDGVFGQYTENALFNLKGVKQIALNAFSTTTKPILIGAKMQAKGKPTKLWSTKKQANGVYFNTGVKIKEIDFGKAIGVYAGKTGSGQFLVKNDGVTYAVKPEEVLFY